MKFSTVKQLQDQRAVKVEEAEAILATATDEQREITDEENEQFQTLKRDIADLDKRIGRQQDIEAFRRANAVPIGNGQDDLSVKDKKDLRKFELGKALVAMAEGRQLDGVEKEVGDMGIESARAANIIPMANSFYVPSRLLMRGQTVTGQTANPGDQGGVTVPEDLNPLINALWSKTWLGPAGARFLNGLQGDQRFPVQISKPTVSELTEIQEMGYTEILFDDFVMKPKRRGATIPFSRQMLLQSNLDIQNLVIENISGALAQYMNVEALGIALGIINAGNNNIVEHGANGGVPTYASIVKMKTKINTKDALLKSPKWVTNPLVEGQLQLTEKFGATNGEPVWGDSNRLLGYEAVVTNLVPSNLVKGDTTNASALLLANWDDLYVGVWDGFEFIVDHFTAKRKNQIEVTANTYYDIKAARAESFAGSKDITTPLVA